jgi:cellulose synthase/poly-beta-1,6-N-acetylglucosamine synthase-like glycosyltransferase
VSWGVAPHEVMLSKQWIAAETYVAALAAHLGVRYLVDGCPDALLRNVTILDGTAGTPWEIAWTVAEMEAAGRTVVLAPPRGLLDLEPPATRAQRLRRAVAGLLKWRPALSAGAPTWNWQLIAIAVSTGLILGGLATAYEIVSMAVLLVLTAAFVPIMMLRLVVTVLGLRQEKLAASDARIPDAELPTYSVLVPLFGESQILPDLVAAISALDYPAAKLDVLLVLESIDAETRRAVSELELPGFIRVVVVPDSEPRTKPKALNYALQFARGAFVVVYDAEDVPDPRQIRLAVATFAASRPATCCLQGRLSIHNTDDGWLARQFALEYAVLFDVTLPGLAKLGLPIPLGGTSNHFPRAVLDRWAAWDPFNVTEDADLGIRLARSGGRIELLDSITWEEAPATFGVWLRQRTRWLKGWMQTYLVHTRQPARLRRELGLLAFMGFHLYSGGLLLSALVYPLFCVAVSIEIWRSDWLSSAQSTSEQCLLIMGAFNLSAAYLSSIAAAVIAVRRRGRARLAFGAPFMPLYWLLISLAAYRALLQLAIAPYLWEKTHHRPRNGRFRA